MRPPSFIGERLSEISRVRGYPDSIDLRKAGPVFDLDASANLAEEPLLDGAGMHYGTTFGHS